jgi:hypothetical protein
MAATHLTRTKTEIATRGDEIYDRDIRAQVETDKNKGNLVLIDVETGSWEMDASEVAASRRLKARFPDAEIWIVRIGLPYVHRIGAGRGHSRS